MNLKSPLELNVYYVTQESLELSNLGIDHEDECELRPMTVYTVDNIVLYKPLINSKPACRIISGGQDYLVNMDYESLKTLIKENI